MDFKTLTQAAREADLAEFFRTSGYTLKLNGANIFIEEFPGLCVKQSTNQWYSFYSNIGRTNNSIDCLVDICGMDFKQAVHALMGQDVTKTPTQSYVKYPYPSRNSPPQLKQKVEFQMPKHAADMRRVFAYLCKERKIPAAIVGEFARVGLLYQSESDVTYSINSIPQTAKKVNAVFVHFENNVAVGGEVQGINSYKRFKGVVAGTGDSFFSYTPRPSADGENRKAYLFESAIDLMSFLAFCDRKKLNGITLVSMAGLKKAAVKTLQVLGFDVLACVDNDDAGRKFVADNELKQATDYLEKADVKDWSELRYLQVEGRLALKNMRESKTTVGRKRT